MHPDSPMASLSPHLADHGEAVGSKTPMKGSAILCSGGSLCLWGEKEDYFHIPKVCCLRCKRIIDKLTGGKD